MKSLIVLLFLSAFFNTVAFSLTPLREAVGVVARVEGLVTVSQDNTLGNAFKGQVILQNARVATTATGSTTIMLNNGCVIVLKPNQAVTVDYRRECKEILASIRPSGIVSGFGFAVTPQILGNALIIGSGIFTGIRFNQAIFRSRSNSALQKLSGS